MLAPFGIMVALVPAQGVVLFADKIVTVGVVLTVIVTVGLLVSDEVQPAALIPLMVYMVVEVGVIVKLVPVVLLGNRV